MNGLHRAAPARALRLKCFAVSAASLLILFAANYGSCRADGSSKLGCFLLAPLYSCSVSMLEAAAFVFVTVVKILTFVLP